MKRARWPVRRRIRALTGLIRAKRETAQDIAELEQIMARLQWRRGEIPPEQSDNRRKRAARLAGAL